MSEYQTPGVYIKVIPLALSPELRTGVPAFLGLATDGPVNDPQPLTSWSEFEGKFGAPLVHGYLAPAVRGFFENGGLTCYAVRIADALEPEKALKALDAGLEKLKDVEDLDLICAPDIMCLQPDPAKPNGWLPPDPTVVQQMQSAVLRHCDDLGNRFAILDSLPCAGRDSATVQAESIKDQRRGLSGTNGALYYPWGWVRNQDRGTAPVRAQMPDGPPTTQGFYVPPCGHVAGVYARSDGRVGVHKAPANEVLYGVLDLEVNLTDADQGPLNEAGINCLRAFPGRGIRVWGARTLSGDRNWTYVNVRRLFLTAGRWIERNMAGVSFETNNPQLWARITRELTGYLEGLYRQGALRGDAAGEAFFVKCDAETNPREVRDLGQVIAEIGLAPTRPAEFIIVRITYSSGNITIETNPVQPAR